MVILYEAAAVHNLLSDFEIRDVVWPADEVSRPTDCLRLEANQRTFNALMGKVKESILDEGISYPAMIHLDESAKRGDTYLRQ